MCPNVYLFEKLKNIKEEIKKQSASLKRGEGSGRKSGIVFICYSYIIYIYNLNTWSACSYIPPVADAISLRGSALTDDEDRTHEKTAVVARTSNRCIVKKW